MRTKAKIASILAFIAILLYAKDKSDIKTAVKYAVYAILIAAPLLVLIWKFRDRLNKIPKGVSALLMVACLFIWRWLHSVSYAAEDILALVVAFIAVFLSFFLDEKYFGSLFTKKHL